MEEQNKHGVISKFFANNKAIEIILIIVIIGGALLVLANLKSPNPYQNLLSYFWSHSTFRECKIEKQEYSETTQDDYDMDCLAQKCYLFDGIQYYETGCSNRDKCKIKKVIKTPIYDTYKGQQEKYYYLGIIPVLEQSCPEGYSAE